MVEYFKNKNKVSSIFSRIKVNIQKLIMKYDKIIHSSNINDMIKLLTRKRNSWWFIITIFFRYFNNNLIKVTNDGYLQYVWNNSKLLVSDTDLKKLKWHQATAAKNVDLVHVYFFLYKMYQAT